VNITGADLKKLIPDELRAQVDKISFPSQSGGTEPYAVVTLDTEFGQLDVVVYRKEMARFMGRNSAPTARGDSASPGSTLDTTTAQTKDYYVGKTRKTSAGLTETLVGFTAGSSQKEKPANVGRRVRHPETDRLVWPIWKLGNG